MGALRIALRCDGNSAIGAGHVGRCLPLAAAFERVGIDATFVGRYEGVAERLLDATGFATRPPEPSAAGLPSGFDGAIVDLYGLPDAQLEEAARGCSLVAFTDERRRTVPGVTFLDYHLNASPTGLSGPDFAPVDPRFAAVRHDPDEGPVLVALGGSHAGNAILEPLVQALLTGTNRPIEVVGDRAPGDDARVRAVGPMTGLVGAMRSAGAIVCGAGVTAYEAACAGLPALLVVLADNQERVARAFSGLAPTVDARRHPSRASLEAAAARLTQGPLASAGPALVDGLGAGRVRAALLAAMAGDPAPPVQRYRPATRDDAGLLLAWRNAEGTRAASRTGEVIEPASHRAWLDGVLGDASRTLFVAEREGVPVASIRFDHRGTEAEISISVDPERQGEGIGRQAIAETTELQLASHDALHTICAETRTGNSASRRAFEAAGYRTLGESGGWVHLQAVG